MKSRRTIAVILCALLILFAGCGASEREYKDDLIVPLEGDERLIIREWSFLLGSGAEVYYQRGDQDPVLLGQTNGGDDGACPFSMGQYEIVREGDTVSIKWLFKDGIWRSKTFELPT